MEHEEFNNPKEVAHMCKDMQEVSNVVNRECTNAKVWRMERFSQTKFARKYGTEQK